MDGEIRTLVGKGDRKVGKDFSGTPAVSQVTIGNQNFYIGMKRSLGEEWQDGSVIRAAQERLVKIVVDFYTHIRMLVVRLHWETSYGRRYCEDVIATEPWVVYMEVQNEQDCAEISEGTGAVDAIGRGGTW